MATLLEMCTNVAQRIPLKAPTSIIGSTHPDAMLLLQLANEEGYESAQRYTWNVLKGFHTFTTVATAAQGTASIPSDFDRFVAETFFNRTSKRPVAGPIDDTEWAEINASLLTPTDPSFIRVGTQLYVSPTPTAGDTMAYTYIKKNWICANSGTCYDSFQSDDDEPLLNSDVFQMGILWRWKQHKGLPYEADQFTYEKWMMNRMLNDGGKRRLQLADVSPAPATRRGRAGMNDYNTIPTS